MQPYKWYTSHDSTHRQARGQSADAALLVEELAEIYITPTPKGWREAEKIKTNFDWYVYVFDTIAGGLYLYPGLITPNKPCT